MARPPAILAVILVLLGALGLVWWMSIGSPAPPAPTPVTRRVPSTAPEPSPRTPEPSGPIEAPPIAVAPVAPPPPSTPRITTGAEPTPTVPSTRALERRLVDDARSAIEGDGAATLVILDRLDREVPGGALAAERQALRVLALLRTGRADEARGLSDVYLEAHPTGTDADRIRRALLSAD